MAPTTRATKSIAPADLDLAAGNYGEVFRVIGQDLAALFPRTLEIETDGVNFEVHGESHPNPFETVKESFLEKVWRQLFKQDSQPSQAETGKVPEKFSRIYDPQEIEEIDRLNSALRSGNSRRADSYSLAERLRTMGAIVDTKKGRLKRLSKQGDRLFVEYWDQQGQLQSAKLTTVIMYRSQLRPDLQPGNAPVELWEGYDF
jgi:hypothetical protein